VLAVLVPRTVLARWIDRFFLEVYVVYTFD